VITCPHCHSEKIVHNGHHHQGKVQLYCKTCHKYFYEDPAKGYPPTNIPFPVIAYLLYFHKKVPEFSNMREFRKFASQWLNCLNIREEEIQRHTIRHWIKNYEPGLEKVISFEEARDFCHKILSEKLKPIPKEVLRAQGVPHKVALGVLKDKFGREYCFDLIRRDADFFDELCELTRKYDVYCWKLLDNERIRRGKRLFLARP